MTANIGSQDSRQFLILECTVARLLSHAVVLYFYSMAGDDNTQLSELYHNLRTCKGRFLDLWLVLAFPSPNTHSHTRTLTHSHTHTLTHAH